MRLTSTSEYLECHILLWNKLRTFVFVIVYCICGHLVKEREANRGAIQCTLDFLSIEKFLSLRRDDLMVAETGKLQNIETIILPIIWKRDASRSMSKGIHDRVLNDPEFSAFNSNMIELKRSVSRWTNLRRKISAIIWRKQNTVNTERIGGSLSIILEKRDHWEIVLTSTKRCPHFTIYTKNLENDAILEVSVLAPIIELFLHLVAMERFLVEHMTIQRKSTNEDACKAMW